MSLSLSVMVDVVISVFPYVNSIVCKWKQRSQIVSTNTFLKRRPDSAGWTESCISETQRSFVWLDENIRSLFYFYSRDFRFVCCLPLVETCRFRKVNSLAKFGSTNRSPLASRCCGRGLGLAPPIVARGLCCSEPSCVFLGEYTCEWLLISKLSARAWSPPLRLSSVPFIWAKSPPRTISTPPFGASMRNARRRPKTQTQTQSQSQLYHQFLQR